jgi:hypothetical protein
MQSVLAAVHHYSQTANSVMDRYRSIAYCTIAMFVLLGVKVRAFAIGTGCRGTDYSDRYIQYNTILFIGANNCFLPQLYNSWISYKLVIEGGVESIYMVQYNTMNTYIQYSYSVYIFHCSISYTIQIRRVCNFQSNN